MREKYIENDYDRYLLMLQLEHINSLAPFPDRLLFNAVCNLLIFSEKKKPISLSNAKNNKISYSIHLY